MTHFTYFLPCLKMSVLLVWWYNKPMENPWKENFKNISCSIQKLLSNPKVNKSSCSLSMFMSYNVGNPMEIRSQKTTKTLTHTIHFLPHPKIGPRPKMTWNHPEPKNIPLMFSGQWCLVTCCVSNTEDWLWAQCNEHV